MPQHTASALPPVFALEGVSKAFGAGPVLDHLEFSIAEGSRVAIIGPSGAGKTTLLRLLAGVLWPDAGRVTALGNDTTRLRGRALRALRRDIGFLYQTDNLVPGLRVAHNVLMGRLGRWWMFRSLWSLLWPQELDRAARALQRVELLDKLWALPGELSGGQQQRVAIARLLVQEPRVMLADEPVSQLDIRLGRDVIELLSGIAAERGATLVVSLHTLDLLTDRFDDVIALRDGRIFWRGAPHALNRQVLRDLYGAEYKALHLDEVRLDV